MLKKIGLGLAGLFVFLLAAAVVLPIIYKDKIKNILVEQVNKKVNATVSIGEVSLSLFTDFPNFTLSVDSVIVANKGLFEGDTLLNIGNFSTSMDLISVIKSTKPEIETITISNGYMHFLVAKNGLANWDLSLPDSGVVETPEEYKFQFSLKEYKLENIDLVYEDKELHMKTVASNLNHTGSGDFTQDHFILNTKTASSALDFSYSGIPYLKNVKAELEVPVEIDLKEFKFTFADNNIKLNELSMKMTGFVAMPFDDIDMNLDISTPNSDFKALLSLLPGIYKNSFASIQTAGKFDFKSHIEGKYNDSIMPSYDIALKVNNAWFKYPELPAKVDDINVDLHVFNKGTELNGVVIDLKKFSANLGGNPLLFSLLARNTMIDPELNLYLKTNINLSTVKNFYPVDPTTKLSGTIASEVSAEGLLSNLEHQNFDRFKFLGSLNVNGVNFNSSAYPHPILLETLQMDFNPKSVMLTKLKGKIASSDIDAYGNIQNLLSYYFKNEPLKGEFFIQSNKLDLNEMFLSDSVSENDNAKENTALSVIEIPSNVNITLVMKLNEAIYDNLQMNRIGGTLRVYDQKVSISNAGLNLMGGNVQMNGSYSSKNIYKPLVDLNLALIGFDIQEAFKTFVTIQKLAPIAEYAKGTFSTNFNISGFLTQDMTPDINSLSGGGLLKLTQVSIQNLKPLIKVSELLKLNNLNQLNLKDLNLSFEFEKGKVFVAPFKLNLDGIPSTVSGSNGFDQSIDYKIEMQIPREKIGIANTAINNLISQAKSKGINYELASTIPVNVFLEGTITDPKIKTDLKSIGAGVTSGIKNAIIETFDAKKKELEDRARLEAEKVKQQLDEKRKQLEQSTKDAADSVKNAILNEQKRIELELKQKADSIKKATEKKLKDEALKKLKGFGK